MAFWLGFVLGVALSPVLLLAAAGWWVSRDPDSEQLWRELI